MNVAQLLKEPIGATRSYELSIQAEQLPPELNLTGPLTGHAHLLRTNRGVLVEGVVEGSVLAECSRCLTSFVLPISVEMEEEFQPIIDVVQGTYQIVDEEDAALLIDEHHILDLSEVLRQAVLLATPIQHLCKPTCAGLCPICGADLNLGSCGCVPEEVDPRWEQLSALLTAVDSSDAEF